MQKKLIFLILCFFIISCGVSTKVIDPVGRELPNPRYTVKGFGNNLTSTFWFSKVESSKDLDGTTLHRRKYLEWRKKHIFNSNDNIEISFEVYNPDRIRYNVFERVQITRSQYSVRTNKLASSDRERREYTFKLPIDKGIVCSYVIDITNESGEILLQIGAFNYSVEY